MASSSLGKPRLIDDMIPLLISSLRSSLSVTSSIYIYISSVSVLKRSQFLKGSGKIERLFRDRNVVLLFFLLERRDDRSQCCYVLDENNPILRFRLTLAVTEYFAWRSAFHYINRCHIIYIWTKVKFKCNIFLYMVRTNAI